MRNVKGQFIKGEKGPWLGKHRSEETKRKLSEANKGKHPTEETRSKISIASTGRHHSDKTKKRLSEIHMGRNNPMFGKTGSLHPNWRGGISYEPYSVDWTDTLKRAIRERDNYICQICSQYGNIIHHIDYNKKNCTPGNLITLCDKCHTKTNFNRGYWIKFLKEICPKWGI